MVPLTTTEEALQYSSLSSRSIFGALEKKNNADASKFGSKNIAARMMYNGGMPLYLGTIANLYFCQGPLGTYPHSRGEE